MSAIRIALALGAVVVAAGLLVLAHDLRAWDSAIGSGDRAYAVAPSKARWDVAPWLPGDPAAAILGVEPRLELRRAVQSFTRAIDVPQSFDNGQRRARLRAAAGVALAGVTETGDPKAASQASNLAGILTETEIEGPTTSSGRAAFEAAVRADPDNEAAAYNLELILRRARVVGTREGSGSGSGARGPARQGAGAGVPGMGY